MENLMSSFYNYVSSTVVPTVTEQASNLVGGATSLAGGAAQVITAVSQTALDWSSGSEDATGSSEVFSWEQQRPTTSSSWWSRSAQEEAPKEKKKKEVVKEEKPEELDADSPNTSKEWEEFKPEEVEAELANHNQFEMVQNSYEWMKRSE